MAFLQRWILSWKNMKWPDGMLNILTSFISGKPCIGHNAPFKPWCNLKHLMNLRWTHPLLFLAVWRYPEKVTILGCDSGNEGIPESFEVVLCYIPILGHLFRCWDITSPRKTEKRKQLPVAVFAGLWLPKYWWPQGISRLAREGHLAPFFGGPERHQKKVHCISSWITGWWFQIFVIFTPKIGVSWFPIWLAHIFQRGWLSSTTN